jgi:hypothetical protein
VTFHGTLQRRLVTRDVGIPNEHEKAGHLELIRRNFSVLTQEIVRSTDRPPRSERKKQYYYL